MKTLTLLAAAAAMTVSGAASAAMLSSAPDQSWTVTNYYKQTVYDPNQNKIGEVDEGRDRSVRRCESAEEERQILALDQRVERQSQVRPGLQL
jgi:hypothetical protein